MDKTLDDRIGDLRTYFNDLTDSELRGRILANLEIIQYIVGDKDKELVIKMIEKYRQDCDV